jgi:uncharacterized protein (TIGR04255 family)
MAERRIPSYKEPPVTEVAVGVTLPALPLETRHVGQFWTEIREEYPITEDAAPIPSGAFTQPIELTFLQMPPLRRVFMKTRDQEYILQLQERRFLTNWRKHPAEAPYPRYAAVLGRFLQSWEKYAAFLKRNELAVPEPTGYELTYVNELEDPNSAGINAFVKPLDWPVLRPEFLTRAPQMTNISWSFVLPDSKGTMNVSVNRTERPGGAAAALLVLSCVGPSSGEYSLRDWFDTAHEWIVFGFTDLTTHEAHQFWKREV